jgi:hypothetical protein
MESLHTLITLTFNESQEQHTICDESNAAFLVKLRLLFSFPCCNMSQGGGNA